MTIFKNSFDDYVLKLEGKTLHINSVDALIILMKDYDVSDAEIELGLTEMVRQDHNVAEYGIGYSGNGPRFIFTNRVGA